MKKLTEIVPGLYIDIDTICFIEIDLTSEDKQSDYIDIHFLSGENYCMRGFGAEPIGKALKKLDVL